MRERIAWSQHRVNRAHRCPICGKDHGLCALFPTREDPQEVLCARVASEEWVDSAGAWRHRLNGSAPRPASTLPAAPSQEIPLAPPEVRDRFYRRARELSEPLDRRRHLPLFTNAKRGMTAAQVSARGYFPWPTLADRYVDGRRRDNDGRWLLAARLVLEEGEAVYGVPGIATKNGKPWCKGYSGIFLPAFDPCDQLVGGQVLTLAPASKQAPKYATLPRAGHQLHCSRPTGHGTPLRDTGRVWLTEGLLKADIASDLLGEVVIGAAGQAFPLETLREYLEALEPSEVVVALDYDAPGSDARRRTDKNRRDLADQLVALGYSVAVAVWEHADGKGLDDLLLAGHRPVLREHKEPRRHRPRQAERPAALPAPDLRPVRSVEDQRQEYEDTLREYLANPGGKSGQEVLLIRLAPGIGKTTGFAKVALEYVDHDRTRSLIHVVPTHEVGHQLGADRWGQVYGRTSDKSPHGRPCHRPEHYQALSERGASRQQICKLCPLVGECSRKERPRDGQPYYLGQFRRRQLTRIPAAHLLSPDLVAKCGTGPLVLDDIDLDQLSLSSTWITEADLRESISAARAEEPTEEGGPGYWRPALSLLEILRDYRRVLDDQESYLHGSELVTALAAWCEEHGRDLDAAVAAALTVADPNPLEGIRRSLDDLRLDTLGPRPVARKIAEVLSLELSLLRDGRTAWNSRLSTGRKSGRNSKEHGLCLQVWEHRPLPLESYAGRPIVVLNASMTREQVERHFPGRTVRVLEPRAPLPEGVTITQYLDHNYGKRALSSPDLQRRAREEVRQIAERHPGKRIGLITHKGFADQLRADPVEGVSTVLHYHGHRSLNTAARVDVWIMLGTPHPREDSLIRATEALYWRDGRPLDRTVAPRTVEVESVDGRRYQVQQRTALDPRLQEQLAQRTALELEQALFRCRPHNLDAPEQGDLFRPLDRERRSSVAIYVFSPAPLGLPVTRVVTEADRLPSALDVVVAAAQKLVRDGRNLTRAALVDATGETRRQVDHAVNWLRREHGPEWWDEREAEQAIPRAVRDDIAEVEEEEIPTAAAPSVATPPPTSWSTVSTRIAEESARPPTPRPATPPPPEEVWNAIGEIL